MDNGAAELESELERIIKKNEEIKRKAQENEIFLKGYLDRFSFEDGADHDLEDETSEYHERVQNQQAHQIDDYLDNFDMSKLRAKYGIASQNNELKSGVMKHLDELELELSKKPQLEPINPRSEASKSLYDHENQHQSRLIYPINQGSLHLSVSNTEKPPYASGHQLDPFTDFRLSSDDPIYEAQSPERTIERSELFKELQRDISKERKKNKRLQMLKDQYHEGDENYELAQARAKYAERKSTSPNPFDQPEQKKQKQTLKTAWEENKLGYFNIQNHGELVNIPSAEVFFLSNKSSMKTIGDRDKGRVIEPKGAAGNKGRADRWTNTLLTYSQDEEPEFSDEQHGKSHRGSEDGQSAKNSHRPIPPAADSVREPGYHTPATDLRMSKDEHIRQLKARRDQLERQLFHAKS